MTVVGYKWISKSKRDSFDNVERYKVRFIAKGFTQKEGIDYHETFFSVSKKDSLRRIMALVAHLDVKITFLNRDLDEVVYMIQLEGFSDGGHKICKLKNSLYRLKQASHQCYSKFCKILTSCSFIENLVNQCIYLKVNGYKYIFLVLYIDDILLTSNDLILLHETK